VQANVGIEYYTRLQKHRRHGKLESNSNRRYIDTTEFWKDQFDKVYQEKKELERKLYRLEERQRQQDSRHSNDQEHEALIVNARKRPADGGEFDGNREGQHKNTAAVDQDILVTLSSYSKSGFCHYKILPVIIHCDSGFKLQGDGMSGDDFIYLQTGTSLILMRFCINIDENL